MGTISSASDRDIWGGQRFSELKPKGLLIYNPKQLFAKLKQKKLEKFLKNGELEESCSSEKERKVDALALRAEEGRDYLR